MAREVGYLAMAAAQSNGFPQSSQGNRVKKGVTMG
jgi:hypothetical protein